MTSALRRMLHARWLNVAAIAVPPEHSNGNELAGRRTDDRERTSR